MASNAESVSLPWRPHGIRHLYEPLVSTVSKLGHLMIIYVCLGRHSTGVEPAIISFPRTIEALINAISISQHHKHTEVGVIWSPLQTIVFEYTLWKEIFCILIEIWPKVQLMLSHHGSRKYSKPLSGRMIIKITIGYGSHHISAC